MSDQEMIYKEVTLLTTENLPRFVATLSLSDLCPRRFTICLRYQPRGVHRGKLKQSPMCASALPLDTTLTFICLDA